MSLDFRGVPSISDNKWISDEDNMFAGFEPQVILDHIFSEIKKARSQYLIEDDIRLLESIEKTALTCKSRVENKEYNLLPSDFFWLGRMSSELESGFYGEKRIEFHEALMRANKSNFPLVFKNAINRGAKELVQAIATNHWKLNPNDRIGDVSQIVWAKTHEFFIYARQQKDWGEHSDLWDKKEEAMPDKPDGIKPWLREVAPKEAQRRGRPKKI